MWIYKCDRIINSNLVVGVVREEFITLIGKTYRIRFVTINGDISCSIEYETKVDRDIDFNKITQGFFLGSKYLDLN
jgi:hypothetical protein